MICDCRKHLCTCIDQKNAEELMRRKSWNSDHWTPDNRHGADFSTFAPNEWVTNRVNVHVGSVAEVERSLARMTSLCWEWPWESSIRPDDHALDTVCTAPSLRHKVFKPKLVDWALLFKSWGRTTPMSSRSISSSDMYEIKVWTVKKMSVCCLFNNEIF